MAVVWGQNQTQGQGNDPTTIAAAGANNNEEIKNGPYYQSGDKLVYSDIGKLRDAQQQNAINFRAGLPAMKQQMAQNLTSDSNRVMQSGLRTSDQGYNSRGLLYGNMAAGGRGRVRANAQANLAKGIQGINMDLESSANELENQALDTAYGIQRTQQAISDATYSRALAQQNANNQIMGSAIGSGLMLAMM